MPRRRSGLRLRRQTWVIQGHRVQRDDGGYSVLVDHLLPVAQMPQGGIRGPVILFRTDEVNPPVPKVLPGAKRLTAFRPGRYCASDGRHGSYRATGCSGTMVDIACL